MRIQVVRGEMSESIVLRRGATAADVLSKLGLYPDAHIVMIGMRPIPLTRELKDGEEIRVLKVASGG